MFFDRVRVLPLAMLLGVAAFATGACDKKFSEEAGAQAFPVAVKVTSDGSTASVQVPAATVGTISTASGGSAGFNAYGNASVGLNSSDDQISISIIVNGRWRKKRIRKSQLA